MTIDHFRRAAKASFCSPRRTRREQALIAAARALFLDKGYDDTSIGDVVRSAGGSLSTLYELFGSKRGLLEAVIRAEQFDGHARLTAILDSPAPPAETLRNVAAEMVRALLDPDLMRLIRLIVSEGLRHPQFAAEMQASFVGPLVDRLTARFEEWRAARIFPADPRAAAEMFASLFCYAPQMRALFLDPREVDPVLLARKIGFQVDVLVAGLTATA